MDPFMIISSKMKCAFSKLNMICTCVKPTQLEPVAYFREPNKRVITHIKFALKNAKRASRRRLKQQRNNQKPSLMTREVTQFTYHTLEVLVHSLHQRMDELEDTQFVLLQEHMSVVSQRIECV